MERFLEFENVTRLYGSLRAVDGVSISIRQGEVFGLLGPSGCGKTTLLRLVAGFDRPDGGRILLNGKDIADLPPDKRPVNTVFQNYALFPHLTVADNIGFGLKMAGRAAAEIEPEVERMLALVHLGEHAGKKPAQLSGGQKQRVAIARALINRPQVLLLDEPLAALDLKLRQRMLMELTAIHEQVGATFVYVTHDQGEAMSLCNRMAVMNRGKVEQLGTPHEIYARPSSGFVASFIGDTNFLDGRIESIAADGGATVAVDDLGKIEAPANAGHAVGARVYLSLRPEKLSLAASPPDAGDGLVSFPGRIEDVIYLGAESRYGVKVGTRKFWVAWQHDRQHPVSKLGRGDDAWLAFAPGDVLMVRCDPAAGDPEF